MANYVKSKVKIKHVDSSKIGKRNIGITLNSMNGQLFSTGNYQLNTFLNPPYTNIFKILSTSMDTANSTRNIKHQFIKKMLRLLCNILLEHANI